jgi:hypothetical protein
VHLDAAGGIDVGAVADLLLQVAQQLQDLVEGGPLRVLVAEARLHRERKRERRVRGEVREVRVRDVRLPFPLCALRRRPARHTQLLHTLRNITK